MASYNPPYSEGEQKKIVDYIVQNDIIDRLKGDAVWKSMEENKVTERTWQSMKQHYRKTISWQLNRRHYELDMPTLQRFYKANRTITVRKNTSRKKSPVASARKYPTFSKFSSDSESDNEVGSARITSAAQNAHIQNNGANMSPSESEVESRIVGISATSEQPSINRTTPSKNNPSTESDLDAHTETQHAGTNGVQDATDVFTEMGDDTNDSVQIVDDSIEYVVINDTQLFKLT